MSNIHIHHWYTKGLLPVLFILYLQAALRDLRDNLPQRPPEDTDMPNYTAYADDVDVISNASQFLDDVQRIAADYLSKWHININEANRERTNIHRRRDEWRMTRKLGSLLWDVQDVARRKQLTAVAIRKLSSPWIRHHSVSQDLRLGLYNVKSHCAHTQHGHLGTNANRMAQV